MSTRFQKKTKIVATLGPASANSKTIAELVYAGVNVFRINFSHGDHEQHKKTIELITQFREETKIRPSILADLQGPKIRLGKNLNEKGEDGIFVDQGEQITFTTDKKLANPIKKVFLIKLDSFAQDVKLSDRILIDDGKMQFKVISSDKKNKVVLEALNSGFVKSKKGVNLPDTEISVPSLTKKDIEDLEFIVQQDVDWIALSFVRKAEDITDLKERIKKLDKESILKIVAKIEKPEAVENIDEIIEVTDAVMVARGDLGVEIPFEQVPNVQTMIVNKCIRKAKPVIIATQVMESMIENPTPTRAEITDVANVVREGADAVMLSGETSVGKHPVKVIKTITKTVLELEQMQSIYNKNLLPDENSPTFIPDAICYNAAKLSSDLNAKAIVVLTSRGFTARTTASFRPYAKIYAFTTNKEIMSRLNLIWGVNAFYYHGKTSTDEALFEMNSILKIKGLLEKDDIVINTASMPFTTQGRTNMIKVSKVE